MDEALAAPFVWNHPATMAFVLPTGLCHGQVLADGAIYCGIKLWLNPPGIPHNPPLCEGV
eukprot:scaffold1724_cov341-Pavlova_lutheri.AAC.47